MRQPRVGPLYSGFEPHLVEAAAGLIDPGETAAAAAMREAGEELGVQLGRVEPVAAAWSMPGVSSERMHLFLAPYSAAHRLAAGGGLASEGEEIEVLELPLKTLVEQADAGALTDIKTLALGAGPWPAGGTGTVRSAEAAKPVQREAKSSAQADRQAVGPSKTRWRRRGRPWRASARPIHRTLGGRMRGD